MITTRLCTGAIAGMLAFILAACGSETGDGGMGTTLEDGSTVATAISDKGLAVPANLPDFAPIYPGGIVDNVVVNERSPGKGILSFKVKATVEEVAGFYRQNGEKAGLDLKQDQDTGSGQSLMFIKPGAPVGDDYGVQLNIGPDMQAADGVVVAMTYSGPA
jgi:hypothetical protein